MTDKTTTGSDAVDLDKLEELAKAATHGPWIFTKYGNVMDSEKIFEIVPSDTMREDRLYIAAANPATVLALIAQARAAAPAAHECEDCNATGRTGEMIPGDGLYQPPEPEMCGTCGGAGLIAAAPAATDWAEAQRICNLPAVDEAIRGLLEDSTGDNATCLVREVMRALSQQPVQAAGDVFNPCTSSGVEFKNSENLNINDAAPVIAVPTAPSDENMTAEQARAALLAMPLEQVVGMVKGGAPTATAEPVATDFDEATLMKLVREFAEVCYGQRHTTEDVGGKLVAYVKSLAAPAPQQAAPLTDAIPKLDENEALRKLAFRTLWLAYVWNDHNFKAAHLEARATCEALGIGSFDEANAWIESINNRVGAASAVTATTEQGVAPKGAMPGTGPAAMLGDEVAALRPNPITQGSKA